MLTDEQKKEYFENSHRCPYCSSTSIQAEWMEIDGSVAQQDIYCESCYKYWTDVYRLVDVEEVPK